MKDQAEKDKLFIAHIRAERNRLMDKINELDRLLDTIHKLNEADASEGGVKCQK